MTFHTFGKIENPVMVLIHGMLTPWTVWNTQIERFSDKYYLVVPVLDGHDGSKDDFISIENQAEKIENYLIKNVDSAIFAVMGLSLGGAVANCMWKRGKVKISKLVMDGAPLVPMSFALKQGLNRTYTDLIIKSTKRDAKTLRNFKTSFLPERYLDEYLQIADNFYAEDLNDIIESVSSCTIEPNLSDTTEIMYIHGTKLNETTSKKSASQLKEMYPKTKVVCMEGCGHCQTACFEPQKWGDMVENFIEW